MDEQKLCQIAIRAMKGAYAPYSGFCVGAALLTEDGTIYTGCNIENAAYSVTVCAERTAIFKAISEGKHKFKAIAVAAEKDGKITGGTPPCGVCRQVLSEFCTADFVVLVVEDETNFKRFTLGDLLPYAFGVDHLS